MLRNTLLLLMATATITLGGCDIYFGSNPNDCGPLGCDSPPLAEPGMSCSSHDQCMAGCYCSPNGVCEEAGFCETNLNCSDGFECQVERASCVPSGSPQGCSDNSQCGPGSYCDTNFNECVPSWSCRTDEECGPGWMCNDANSCQPMPCTSDDQCLPGCVCNEETMQCEETGFCEADYQCPEGMVCDRSRNTCTDRVPPDPGSCVGEVTCDTPAPVCGDGYYPGIADGCYTGYCIAEANCDEIPQPLCSEITDEDACFARTDCRSVYRGVNCSDPDGNQCNSDDANCTCERFVFSTCEARE